MSTAPLRVAMIGRTGHFFLRAALAEPDADVAPAAVASDGWCGPVGAPGGLPSYDDPRAMLDEVRPDVVEIGAWYAHNGELALEALRRGIHVVTDKPAVNSWDELRQAERICAARPGLHWLTEFSLRMSPAFRACRGAVTAGRVGAPVMARAQKSYKFGASRPDFYRDRAHYAGTLFWVGSHAVDVIRWATGREYLSFFGVQGNVAKPEYGSMEDHVAVVARLSGGASAALTADFLRPDAAPTHGDDRLRIAGADGVVEVIDDVCTLITRGAPAEVLAEGRADSKEIGRELAATLRGCGDGTFSTGETLATARALLTARDACDAGRETAVPPRDQKPPSSLTE